MNPATSPLERQLCPDCGVVETQGRDKFGMPMPCAPCLVARLVKAFHEDQEDQAMLVGERPQQTVWSREAV
jgi:hypothetical protein